MMSACLIRWYVINCSCNYLCRYIFVSGAFYFSYRPSKSARWEPPLVGCLQVLLFRVRILSHLHLILIKNT